MWSGLLSFIIAVLCIIPSFEGTCLAAEIAGRITSARTGQGIAGAVVRAIGLQRNRRDVQTASLADGSYHLDLVRGQYRLFISAPNTNYLPQYYSASGISLGEAIEVPTYQSFIIINVSLVSGGSISGSVRRSLDGDPIRNVRVSAESKNSRVSVNTREDGSYVFMALPPDDYRIHVVPLDESYIPAFFSDSLSADAAEVLHLEADQELADVNFQLRAGGIIAGRVLARKNREPIAGIKVIAEKQNSKEPPVFTYTDPQGFYQLQGLVDGQYVVETGSFRASSDPSAVQKQFITQYYEGRFDKELAAKIQIENGNSVRGVNFSLVLGSRLSGAVRSRSSNAPLEGVSVLPQNVQKEILQPVKGKTDASGNYSIENLLPGEYLLDTTLPSNSRRFVKVFYQDKLSSNLADKVLLEEDGWTRGIDFNLILGATLEGRFKTDDAEYKQDPTVNSVSLKRVGLDLEGFGEREYKLAKDGTFMIVGTPPGKYSLVANLHDPNVALQRSQDGKVLDVFEGDVVKGLDFPLKVGGSITGSISSKSNGYPLDQLMLLLISVKENTKTFFDVSSEHYTLVGIEPGKYVVILLSNPEKTHPNSSFQPTRVFDTRTVEVVKGKTTTGVDFPLTVSAD